MEKILLKLNQLLIVCSVLSLISCSRPSSTEITSSVDDTAFAQEDFLAVDGTKIRNNHGKGDEVILRGTNAGGYLVIEQWMTAFEGDNQYGYYDHTKVNETFNNRFGKEKTLKLWQTYRENYWNEFDFQNCAEMNMSVIRLPFSHFVCDPSFNNVRELDGEKYNFEVLDNFVEMAASYGMYTILDLHATYGSHNGQDHGGEALSREEVDFYQNEEKMSKTVDLWKAVSNHFKNNPAIAGYDILNEPGEKGETTKRYHWDFLDRIYDAIRDNNDQHIVIFESCWDGRNLPQPSEYGWQNCMYSFHNYSGERDADKNLQSMIKKITGAELMNFGVPLFMGEFNCYGVEESWVSTLQLFNNSSWHWTSWTYKLNRLDEGHQGWGIFYSAAPKVRPNEDSFETIIEKWTRIDTAYESSYLMRFNSYNSLFDIMKQYCGE